MRRRRVGTVAAAGALLALAGAAVWVLAANDSPDGVAVPTVPPAKAPAGLPPPPPRGALVLARGHGTLAVGLAARRAGSDVRLTATVVTGDGTGLSGLRVRFATDTRQFAGASPCGPGCYASTARAAASARHVSIELSGPRRPRSVVAFTLPPRWPVPAAPTLQRAERVIRSLRSAVYRERLSTGAGKATTTLWRHEAPDRLSYDSDNGNAGVVIGRTRWDLVVGGGWKRSLQHPPLAMPAVPWGAGAYDVNLLGGGRIDGRAVVRLSLFEPSTPAWYTVTLDRATLRPVIVDMTATAHFMRDRYLAFDLPRRIRPPVKD